MSEGHVAFVGPPHPPGGTTASTLVPPSLGVESVVVPESSAPRAKVAKQALAKCEADDRGEAEIEPRAKVAKQALAKCEADDRGDASVKHYEEGARAHAAALSKSPATRHRAFLACFCGSQSAGAHSLAPDCDLCDRSRTSPRNCAEA